MSITGVSSIYNVYDNKIKEFIEREEYIEAYSYIYQQKSIVKSLNRNLYDYLIIWQIIVEVYFGIIDEAKEHFYSLYKNIKVDINNLIVFVKAVLLLDMTYESLQVEGLFDTLINFDGDDFWIKFYLLLVSFKNKRRTFEILEELIYIMGQTEDKFLLAKIHALMSEIYKEQGDARWVEELKVADNLNPDDLYVMKLKLNNNLIDIDRYLEKNFFRIFPEDSELVNKYYGLYRKNKNKKIDGFKFYCLGGGNIGASSYLISYKGVNVLLDSGILIKDGKTYYNELKDLPVDVKEIDLVVITHAHLDHCGGIKNLVNSGLDCPIIMSKETYEIFNGIFFRQYKKSDMEVNQEDFNTKERLEYLFICDSLNTFTVKDRSVLIKLMPSGHMFGARAVYLEIDGFSIFYTGDFTLKDVETNKGLKISDKLKADVLITEATYGYGSNFTVYNKYIQDKLLITEIKNLIGRDGKLLIPVYAIGKAQDLLMLLKKSFSYIPFNVYVDGDVAYFTKIYEEFTGDIYGKGILNVADNSSYSSKKEFIRKEVSLGNCLILASSNSLKEGSVSYIYANEMLEFDNSSILHLNANNRETNGIKSQNLGLLNHGSMCDILEVAIKLSPSAVFIVHRGYKTNDSMNIVKILNDIEGLKVYEPIEGELIEISERN